MIIRDWISYLTHLGCGPDISHDETNRIVLSNRIIWIYIFLIAPYIPIFSYMGSLLMGALTIGILGVMFLCLYLNKRKKFLIARSLFICDISLPIYFFAAILGPESGIQLVVFVTMTISFVIFNEDQKYIKYAFVLMQLGIYVLLELTQYAFFYKISFSSFHLMILQNTVIINVFIIIFLTLKYYSNMTVYFKKAFSNISKLHALSDRETEIVSLVFNGKSNKEIAELLYIEVSTVKSHLGSIYRKFNVANRIQMVALISKQG